jgi:hypothetical protein
MYHPTLLLTGTWEYERDVNLPSMVLLTTILLFPLTSKSTLSDGRPVAAAATGPAARYAMYSGTLSR